MNEILKWLLWMVIPVCLLGYGTYKAYKEKKRNIYQTAGALIGVIAALYLIFTNR